MGCDFLGMASFYYHPEKKKMSSLDMPIVHFLTQTEGFRAVTERDQFENIFLPNL